MVETNMMMAMEEAMTGRAERFSKETFTPEQRETLYKVVGLGRLGAFDKWRA